MPWKVSNLCARNKMATNEHIPQEGTRSSDQAVKSVWDSIKWELAFALAWFALALGNTANFIHDLKAGKENIDTNFDIIVILGFSFLGVFNILRIRTALKRIPMPPKNDYPNPTD